MAYGELLSKQSAYNLIFFDFTEFIVYNYTCYNLSWNLFLNMK